MTNIIQVEVSGLKLQAELYDTPTAQAIWEALPLDGLANVWGEEIYFEVQVHLEREPGAREEVEIGELGYWPEGHALCIFFGPTPVSQGDQPRAYSPVNVFGKVRSDTKSLRFVRQGERVIVKAL